MITGVGRPHGIELPLKIQAAHAWHSDIHNNTSGPVQLVMVQKIQRFPSRRSAAAPVSDPFRDKLTELTAILGSDRL